MNHDYLKLEQQKTVLWANVTKLAIFGLLAFLFDKWWIVLFVILFWTSIKDD